MNDSKHASLKTRPEAQEKGIARIPREDKAGKNLAGAGRCVALYYQLDEARKRQNLCRHLLGRAHLL